MDHRAEFEHLVRDRLGGAIAAQALWMGPRLICIAGDFTRYDVHAVCEHRRSIDLARYRPFGNDLLGLETRAGDDVALASTMRPAAAVVILGGAEDTERSVVACPAKERFLDGYALRLRWTGSSTSLAPGRATRTAAGRRARRGHSFATKPELARVVIERFLDAGHRVGWGAGDEV